MTLNILNIAVTLAVLVVTGLLIPWLKTKTKSAAAEQLLNAVTAAVLAAEQTYRNAPGSGAKKLETVKSALIAQGYELSSEVLTEIEAAVYRAFNSGGVV